MAEKRSRKKESTGQRMTDTRNYSRSHSALMQVPQSSNKARFLKVVLLGQGSVGKSSLMAQYVNKEFEPNRLHTIGVEFLNKELTIDDQNYTIQIWDTAGQERFKSLRTPFYRGSDVCMLVFSLTDPKSFMELETWKKEFEQNAQIETEYAFPYVILGNKSDLKDERQVTEEEARSFVKNYDNMTYFETSAKTDSNVDKAFEAAVKSFVKYEKEVLKRSREDSDVGSTVNLNEKKRENKSCSC